MTKLNPLIEAMSNIDDALVQKAQKTAKAPIRLRTLAVAAAAALTLGATAVGAVAVYSHNTAEEYARVLQQHGDAFKQEYKTSDGEEVNLNTEAVNKGLYDELNIELNETFEYEDFTLEFPGAICDGKNILLMYNITFKKDLKCLELPYQNFWLFGRNDTVDPEGLHGGTRANNGIMSEVDGKKVYSGFKDYSGIEYCGDSLNLHFEQVWASGSAPAQGIFKYEQDIDVDLEIPLTGDLARFNKTIVADTEHHIDLDIWGEWDVVGAEISPLLITFNVKTDGDVPGPNVNIFKEGVMVFPVNVTMKDGSTLDLGSGAIHYFEDDEETKTGAFTAVLNYPIDVDNVQSVEFDGVVIDIDGTATTVDTSKYYERFDENGHLIDR